MFEGEKRKVGRPKLADSDLKRKSLLFVIVCFIVVLALLFTCAYKLNIIKFSKLKGEVICGENDIPLRFQPRTETNPEGLHEYGFTDPNFYSAVVTLANRNNSNVTCQDIDETDLGNIIGIYNITDSGDDSERISFKTDVIREATNFNGIQYLTGLKYIRLRNNNVSELDLSNNRELRALDLSYESIGGKTVNTNSLETINLEENTKLTSINLRNNKLHGEIDFSHNTKLVGINLTDNKKHNDDTGQDEYLTNVILPTPMLEPPYSPLEQLYIEGISNLYSTNTIDLSGYPNLKNLSLAETGLKTINLDNNINLKTLNLYFNKLKGIDLSNHINLTSINLKDNSMDDCEHKTTDVCLILPVPGDDPSPLSYLSVSAQRLHGGKMYNIDVSPYPNLETLEASRMNLESLDLRNNPKLTYVSAYANNITKVCSDSNKTCEEVPDGLVDLSGLPLLDTAHFGQNSFTDIDFTNNLLLTTINLYNNNLENIDNLDLTHNDKLKSLTITNSKLNSVTLNENAPLNTIVLNKNNLSTLNVMPYSNLTTLQIWDNKIEEIDLSQNPKLTQFYAKNNLLTSVDISNNTMLNRVNIDDNPLSKTYDVFLGYPESYNHSVITNGEYSFDISDTDIADISDGIITGKAIGGTTFSVTYELPYVETTEANPWHVNSRTINDNNIRVFGITSNKNSYTFDYENRVINVNGEVITDVMNHLIISDGYTMELVNTNEVLITKDGDDEPLGEPFTIEGYILHPPTTKATTTKAATTTTKKANVGATTQKHRAGARKSSKKKTTTNSAQSTTNSNVQADLNNSDVADDSSNASNFNNKIKVSNTKKTSRVLCIIILITIPIIILLFLILLFKRKKDDEEE